MIPGASDGNFAWVTDADAPYADNEASAVFSPIFDFSGLSNPSISLDVFYETEAFFDGATLQATTDGGATWRTVGSVNDFYNNNVFLDEFGSQFIPGWSGNQADGSGPAPNDDDELTYIRLSANLSEQAGASEVQFRVLFNSGQEVGGPNQFEGFAFDNVRIIDEPAPLQVVSFTLIDAENDQEIGTLNDGDVLNLSELPSADLTIRANIGSEEVGSVDFSLTSDNLGGLLNVNRFENEAPYVLFGDDNGDFLSGHSFLPGDYTLVATPFTERRAEGIAGEGLEVSFSVVSGETLAVEQLILVDADNDVDLVTLTEGATIDLSTLPTRNLSIRATTNVPAGSVELDLTGTIIAAMTENIAPYVLFGDDLEGDIAGQEFTAGVYNMTATPFAEAYGAGDAGTALSITFNLVEGTGSRQSSLALYGNGTHDFVILKAQAVQAGAQLMIFDNFGQLVYSEEFTGEIEKTIDLNALKGKVFISRLIDGDKVINRRIIHNNK